MTPLRHEMLIANAGSGKTFRLTVRTIILLALGVDPSRIVALTFTRKAAGEFLAAVFVRLAKAASDEQALADLRADTHLASLDAAQCRGLLAGLTTQLHRLSMGTIDSLFARIARSFPLETGLSGEFTVLSDTARQTVCRDTLAEVFRVSGENEESFQDFLDLIRQQSRKQSEREVFNTLLASVNSLHEKFLSTPKTSVWGDADLIWPGGSAILLAGTVSTAADALWHAITTTHPALDQKAIDAWTRILQVVRDHPPNKLWSKELKTFIERKVSIDKETQASYFPTGGSRAARVYLHADVESAWKTLLLALFKPRIEELLRRSRALHGVLATFETAYSASVRNQGQLTFGDVTSVLAAQVESVEWRTRVGYRLDGQFDHWLLDEFQDTSRLQWKVLHGLVDDIIQDAEGERSFFYVGDTKQAIYSWRGGDPRLFFEIAGYYNHGEVERISRAEPLDVSYRSDPEIIKVVNLVFGALVHHAETLQLPEKTLADWTRAWVTHEVAPKNAGNRGYVGWQPVERSERSERSEMGADDELNPVDQAIASLLLETRPWERGWSCAALKRNNKSVEELAALLQSRGIPVAVEGRANPCTDNPAGVLLLAAFRFAASPADRLSRALLAASPRADVLLGDGDYQFREAALRVISEAGFVAACEKWLQCLDLTSEPFLTSRAHDFLTAATQFDAGRQPGDDLAAFIHHIESYQRQEPEGAGVVRIMTIHQAKGLTLDMTIVSGLDSDPLAEDNTAGSLALDKNARGELWGLLMPGSEICKADPVLDAARKELIATSAYGELCTAYVAMTRPRHALYLLTKKIKENSTARTFARLLTLALGYAETGYELGDPDWHLQRPLLATAAADTAVTIPLLATPLRGTPRALSPSHASSPESHPRASISAAASQAGSEVHAALAGIEWLDLLPPPLAALAPQVRETVERFLQTPAARSLFARPEAACLLWRERAFECRLDGRWVAGVFDRVLIYLQRDGTPLSAEVIDFKTDRTDAETLQTRHAAQMEVYRRAAALLLSLELSKVTGRVVAVETTGK